jgi:hypothetical protein
LGGEREDFLLEAAGGDLAVAFFDFDTDGAAAEVFAGAEGSAGAAEGVEDEVALVGEPSYEEQDMGEVAWAGMVAFAHCKVIGGLCSGPSEAHLEISLGREGASWDDLPAWREGWGFSEGVSEISRVEHAAGARRNDVLELSHAEERPAVGDGGEETGVGDASQMDNEGFSFNVKEGLREEGLGIVCASEALVRARPDGVGYDAVGAERRDKLAGVGVVDDDARFSVLVVGFHPISAPIIVRAQMIKAARITILSCLAVGSFRLFRLL